MFGVGFCVGCADYVVVGLGVVGVVLEYEVVVEKCGCVRVCVQVVCV